MAQLPVDTKALLQGFQQSQHRTEMSDTEGAYLKLDKSGTWQYGSEEIEVEPGSHWAINPATMASGFVAWTDDGEKMGEEMAPLASGDPVVRSQLDNVGAPWKPQGLMELKCLDGEDEGTQVVYAASSVGGMKAFKRLAAAITAKLQDGSGKIIPIVELDVDSYKHKKYGKIYTPVLNITDWMGLDALPDDTEPEPEDEPEQEPEPQATPTRRRRRA